jgi:VCBS repeat-containing protein
MNNPPAALGDAYGTDQDNTLDVPAPGILANDIDPDGDALTAVLQNDASHGTLALSADGSFTYTPVPGYYGSDNFTYTASDGAADSQLATVSLAVHQDNSAGVFPSFTVSYMRIDRANPLPEARRKFDQWSRNLRTNQQGHSFSLWGKVKLPEGYTEADLEKSASVAISINGESGNDTVNFRDWNVRRMGVIWLYRDDKQSADEYLDITRMTVLWYPKSSRWAGWARFYLKGALEFPGELETGTTPLEAKVSLEMPVNADGGGGSLTGEDTVECKIVNKSKRWRYR